VDNSIENAHSTDVTALKACLTYDNILISGSANGEIKIWDVILGKVLKTLRNSSGWVFNIITFERPHIASIVNSNRKQIIDTWKKENSENYCSPQKSTFCSPKKSSVAAIMSGSKALDKFISPTKGSNVSKTHSDQLSNISFMTSSFDGSIKIWEASSEQPSIV